MIIDPKKFIAAREARDLSQDQLADIVGMSQQGIASIETGHSKRHRKLRELARALNRAEDDLLMPEDGEKVLPGRKLLTYDGGREDAGGADSTDALLSNLTVAKTVDGGLTFGKEIDFYRAVIMSFEPRISFDDVSKTTKKVPSFIDRFPDLYAADVPDDSVKPAYRTGMIVYAVPKKPPPVEEYAIFRFKPDAKSSTEWGVIRQFAGENEAKTHYIVRRHKPAEEEYEISKDDLTSVDHIVSGGII